MPQGRERQPSGFLSLLHLSAISHQGSVDRIEKFLIVERPGQGRATLFRTDSSSSMRYTCAAVFIIVSGVGVPCS